MKLTTAKRILRLVLYYSALAVFISVIWIRVATLVRWIQIDHVRTTAENLALLQAPIFLYMAWLVLVFIRREHHAHRSNQAQTCSTEEAAPLNQWQKVSVAADLWPQAFKRRPLLATVMALFMFAIPLAIAGLAFGFHWESWAESNWVIAGLSEAPMLTLAAVALYKYAKR